MKRACRPGLNSSTDSPRVIVGRIGRPRGVRGEVTLVPDSDDPGRFAPGAEMVTDRGRTLVVRSASPYRDRGLSVRFEGVDDRTQAEALRGSIVSVSAANRRPLTDGEFWPGDLVGLAAVAGDGGTLGVVTAVEFGVGQDRILVTTPDERTVLVPFVRELVGDPKDGRIEIRDPGGLFPGA